jgi:hypothetical protein
MVVVIRTLPPRMRRSSKTTEKRIGPRSLSTRSAATPRAPARPLPEPDELLRLIRGRNRRGESLRREDTDRQEPRLVRAAYKHFGSWRYAVEAAGFVASGKQRWDSQRILSEIAERHTQGASLASSRVPVPLREAGVLHFGSWRAAIERAGLDYSTIRLSQGRSPERVLELIREGAETGRQGVGPQGAIPHAVAEQARQEFGSVSAAIEAAGLDPGRVMQVRRFTEDQVAAELRKLARASPDMTISDVSATAVGSAARKRFGSVVGAAKALEIVDWPRHAHQPLPSREEVLTGVKRRHRSGASMRLTEVLHTDRRLMNGAYKHFGTWRSALLAAGVPYEQAHWSRRQVMAELRARRLRREGLSAAAIQRDDPRLWSATIAQFGSLSRALKALDV